MDGAVIPNDVRGNAMANLAGVLRELTQERDRLNQVIQVIGNLFGRNRTGVRARRPKRTLSAAARRKISLAQKARWAKTRRAAPTTVRTMSHAARSKIAAAQRARWAKVRQRQEKKAA
jgi:hypothetical protein